MQSHFLQFCFLLNNRLGDPPEEFMSIFDYLFCVPDTLIIHIIKYWREIQNFLKNVWSQTGIHFDLLTLYSRSGSLTIVIYKISISMDQIENLQKTTCRPSSVHEKNYICHIRVPDVCKPLYTQFQGIGPKLKMCEIEVNQKIFCHHIRVSDVWNPNKPNFKAKGRYCDFQTKSAIRPSRVYCMIFLTIYVFLTSKNPFIPKFKVNRQSSNFP